MTLSQLPPNGVDEDEDAFSKQQENVPSSSEGHGQSSRGRQHAHQREIEQLKKEHKMKVQEMLARYKQEKTDWERMMKEQTRAIHENYEREYIRLNKNYETQLEHVREVYTAQITQILQVLKNAIDSQIVTAKESAVAHQSADRTQIDELKKWMVEEFTKKVIKYTEIMASVEADEANKAALSSAKDVSIDIDTPSRRAANGNGRDPDAAQSHDVKRIRKNSRGTNQRVTSLDADPQSTKERLQANGIPQRKRQATKREGGIAGFFRSLGTT